MDTQESEHKFAQADTLFKQGRYEEAMKILSELDRFHPGAKNIMYPMAMCLEKLDCPGEAQALCDRLIAEFGDPRAVKLKARLMAGPEIAGAGGAFEDGGAIGQEAPGPPGGPAAGPAPGAGPTSHRSQAVAYLLSGFFGSLGVDQFYLGNILLGVLKLITFGGFGIWTMVDLIMIGIGVKRDHEGLALDRGQIAGAPRKSQAVAFILSGLFGVLGVDRFYMGCILLGLLKLFTLGGLGVWWTVDTFLIGMGIAKDGEGNSLAY